MCPDIIQNHWGQDAQVRAQLRPPDPVTCHQSVSPGGRVIPVREALLQRRPRFVEKPLHSFARHLRGLRVPHLGNTKGPRGMNTDQIGSSKTQNQCAALLSAG